jgi:hypothetical protein
MGAIQAAVVNDSRVEMDDRSHVIVGPAAYSFACIAAVFANCTVGDRVEKDSIGCDALSGLPGWKTMDIGVTPTTLIGRFSHCRRANHQERPQPATDGLAQEKKRVMEWGRHGDSLGISAWNRAAISSTDLSVALRVIHHANSGNESRK